MNILIIGNGGREAAIAHYLHHKSSQPQTLFAAPNMPAVPYVQPTHLKPNQHTQILEFVQNNKIQLVIVGPELPLWEGLSDFLRSHNIAVFGPSKKGAELECSKLFCKEFLIQAGIPTSPYDEVFDYEHALERAKFFQPPWILKVDGLAAGKGVYICKTENELKNAAQEIFQKQTHGRQRAFLENFLPGKELSYLVLTNGMDAHDLPLAQDHKRVFENDEGPNTGGMGTVAPLKIPESLHAKIREKIVEPFLKELQKQNILYRGVVYFGIMVDADQNPYVLEINARFGDPEAQVLLPLLTNDAQDLFWQVAHGRLPQLHISNHYASCVVLAAPGYPDHPEKGLPIAGDIFSHTKSSYFLPAGVSLEEGVNNKNYVTSGGRVLNAVGIGSSANTSLEMAYLQAQKISWKGLHYRKDIGRKVLDGNIFRF